MDLTESIIPKSDQLNADDLISGPVTVTIAKVSAGSAEQPVDVHLVEFPGRAFRPSKSMRRVMVSAWGVEAGAYTGHRMTLYRDPTIRFGGMEVGGIRISHLSHIDKSFALALTVTRGKRSMFTIEPLADPAPAQSDPTAEQVAACSDSETLRKWWRESSAETRPVIEARVAELNTTPAATPANNQGISDRTRRQMFAELGKAQLLDDDEQRAEIAEILGQPVKSRSEVTEVEALAVIADLQQRIRTAAATEQGSEYAEPPLDDPTMDDSWPASRG